VYITLYFKTSDINEVNKLMRGLF